MLAKLQLYTRPNKVFIVDNF